MEEHSLEPLKTLFALVDQVRNINFVMGETNKTVTYMIPDTETIAIILSNAMYNMVNGNS
jgi:hypothetical protein